MKPAKSPPLARSFVVTLAVGLAVSGATSGCGGQIIGPGGACPSGAPLQGGSCLDSLSCSYHDECGTSVQATCEGGKWSVSYAGTCNPPPPETCPDVAPYGVPCWDSTLTCSYEDDCGQSFTASCDGSAWQVGEPPASCNPPPPVVCPEALPPAGTSCAPDWVPAECPYQVASACGPLAEVATCGIDAAGVATWSISGETCSPMQPQCDLYGSAGACQLDATCRWLEPAGCPAPGDLLVPAGCYPVDDCAVDGCAAGSSCEPVAYDPCWDKQCNACSALGSVCL